MNTVRIKFQKTGLSIFFSHLDLQKVMQRALKISGLPVWYSKGFNPHIYMTFTLPLSLGHESLCESFDFRLEEEMTEQQILKAMENKENSTRQRVQGQLNKGNKNSGRNRPIKKW